MCNNEFLLKNYDSVIMQIQKQNQNFKKDATLLMVSKQLSKNQIIYIINNREQKKFGENRIQDSIRKWSGIKEKNDGISLHLIGKLQTNKIKQAVKLFDVIETIDSFALASQVYEEALKINKKVQIYLQINIGNEQHKNGISLRNLNHTLNAINQQLMDVSGIMCLPPKGKPAFFYFGLMQKIARDNKLSTISMGMSNDFCTAIKFGATQVRIGSLITQQYI